MKKNLVKKLGVVILAGAMLTSVVGCGSSDTASSNQTVVNKVEASDSEVFSSETLDAAQVKLVGKVYDIPFDYSKIAKKVSLKDEMTQQFNVKVPANGTLDNIYVDVVGKDQSMLLKLQNKSDQDETPTRCRVAGITLQAGTADASTIVLPGGITFEASAYEVETAYGEPDKTVDEKTGFQYVYERTNVTYTFYFSREFGGLQKISFEYTGL